MKKFLEVCGAAEFITQQAGGLTVGKISEREVSWGQMPNRGGLDAAGQADKSNGAPEASTPISNHAFADDDPVGRRVIYIVAGFFVAFIAWASFTELEEVTRGDGRVIPSQKTQIIQSAEPGVISEIFVRAGQRIKKDDLLIRLDKTPNAANLGEVEAKVRSLEAQLARLELEQQGKIDQEYECPAGLKERAPAVCATEAQLFKARVNNLRSRMNVFEEKAEQKRRELREAEFNVTRLEESLKLAEQELRVIKPMAAKKVVAQIDLIKAQRAVAETGGQLAAAKEARARTEAGVREATLQIDEQQLIFRQAALAEMTEKRAEYSVVQETTRGAEERLKRTDIRSPVDGVVNEILFNTQGAFLNAGDRVLSIVPLDDSLVIEARVKPSDIAFIHVGQPAVVKVTAYDFSIYGGLDGVVENVAADTIVDPVTKDPYYAVIVRTNSTVLESDKVTLSIMPGMVCNVDILTGRKTVMQYLLKPINKARELALRER